MHKLAFLPSFPIYIVEWDLDAEYGRGFSNTARAILVHREEFLLFFFTLMDFATSSAHFKCCAVTFYLCIPQIVIAQIPPPATHT